MEKKNLSRRVLLERGAQLPLGGLFLLAVGAQKANAAETAVCVDFEELDAGQRSIRESLEYVDEAADQAQSCQMCAYFKPTEGGCGDCDIFVGPANSRGHCVAWSPKEG